MLNMFPCTSSDPLWYLYIPSFACFNPRESGVHIRFSEEHWWTIPFSSAFPVFFTKEEKRARWSSGTLGPGCAALSNGWFFLGASWCELINWSWLKTRSNCRFDMVWWFASHKMPDFRRNSDMSVWKPAAARGNDGMVQHFRPSGRAEHEGLISGDVSPKNDELSVYWR